MSIPLCSITKEQDDLSMRLGSGPWLAALTGVAALVVTGCAGQAPQPVADVSAGYSALEWADGSEFRISRIDLQDATEAVPGKDFKEVSTTERWSLGSESFASFGLDSRGQLVGAMVENQGIDASTNSLTSGSRVGLVVGGEFQAWSAAMGVEPSDELRQLQGGDSDGANFVWSETPDTSLVATSWKIFAKAADASAPVLLAKSGDTVEDPSFGAGMGGISPVIHDDRVYWHTTVGPEIGGLLDTQIVSTDLSGQGKTRIEDSGAAYPVSLDDAVAAVKLEKPDGEGEEGEPNFLTPDDAQGIVLLNNDGTKTDLLKITENAPEGRTFGTLNGSGNALSFSFNGETFVVDTKNKKVVAFTEPRGSYLSGLAHCDDMVTWTYTDANGEGVASQYVYNTRKQTLRAVGEPELFGNSLCQGKYLAWSVRDSSNDSALATDVVTKWKE